MSAATAAVVGHGRAEPVGPVRRLTRRPACEGTPGPRAVTPRQGEAWAASTTMLRAVLDGDSLDGVAARAGIARSAVERRVKQVALHLVRDGQVPGLHADAVVQVQRLREWRDGFLAALDVERPAPDLGIRQGRVLSAAEVAQGAQRLRARCAHPDHDLALYHLLFATGLRPLEVARLQVADYLGEDGEVRRESVLRAEVAINGRSRPLHFRHHRLDEELASYLAARLAAGQGVGCATAWRGLAPNSPLLLNPDGVPYPILPNGTQGQQRSICRALLDVYRRIFRHSGIPGMCGQSARLTLMARMVERGADEDQVGLVLGIADRSAVREMLPRRRPTLAQVLEEPA